ncbi:arsenate-mycothiol transferase [Arthrobacter sp. UYCu712]
MTKTTKTPSVLFVCSKNGGKSQLAAGLMNQLADGAVTVHSAGTKPGRSLNPQAVESLAELGIDITGEHPKPVTGEVLNTVDVVIVLGTEAKVEPHEGTRLEVWDTDEPSTRGIEGMERIRLVRDDIKARVQKLHAELTGGLGHARPGGIPDTGRGGCTARRPRCAVQHPDHRVGRALLRHGCQEPARVTYCTD